MELRLLATGTGELDVGHGHRGFDQPGRGCSDGLGLSGGATDLGLTFSPPVELRIKVDNAWEGRTVVLQSLTNGSKTWEPDGTASVQCYSYLPGGKLGALVKTCWVSVQVDHATKFVASLAPSVGGGDSNLAGPQPVDANRGVAAHTGDSGSDGPLAAAAAGLALFLVCVQALRVRRRQ